MKKEHIKSTQSSHEGRIKELESQLSAAREQIASLEKERAALREAYERLWQELELIKRRLYIAKAERVDTTQLELEFAEKLQQLDEMAGTLGVATTRPGRGAGSPSPAKKPRSKPTGRRNLKDLPLPEDRIELPDPLFEQLVAEGKATRIGFEESCKLAWQSAGMRRLVIARVKYQAVDARGKSTIETTPMPAETFPRLLAAPSMLARVIGAKFNDGMPFQRQEEGLGRSGLRLDRGTMCRWAEDAGSTLGATVVEAMRCHALKTAFCIAGDATGIAVQPGKSPDGKRRPCRRGHYFVLIADRDHIWFEYTAKETAEAVSAMFKGYSGYVQVDAKSVFNDLFRDNPGELDEDGEPVRRVEVGCWAHARRKYWEAALANSPVAREALARIARIFELDASWLDNPPAEIHRHRQEQLRPHVESFLEWAATEHEKVRDVRGSLRSALVYTVNQRTALARFLDDGRLRLDNNHSELQLRGRVAVGRKAWLFVGSDDHAESSTGIMSLVASARLHNLDPERYLRDIFRVLAHWPPDRYLELAPKFWTATRARLDPAQLAAEVGELTIPEPLPQPSPE